MLFHPKHEKGLERLKQKLHRAQAVTPELMTDVIEQACLRFAAHGAAAKIRVHQLIDAGAWTDAIQALLELELPQWKLRRIVYDDGEWICTLSKDRRLPLGLDEVAEASHETLPLAILIAFVQAREAVSASPARATTTPRVRASAGHAMSCDNFA